MGIGSDWIYPVYPFTMTLKKGTLLQFGKQVTFLTPPASTASSFTKMTWKQTESICYWQKQ